MSSEGTRELPAVGTRVRIDTGPLTGQESTVTHRIEAAPSGPSIRVQTDRGTYDWITRWTVLPEQLKVGDIDPLYAGSVLSSADKVCNKIKKAHGACTRAPGHPMPHVPSWSDSRVAFEPWSDEPDEKPAEPLIEGARYRVTRVYEGIADGDGDLKMDEGEYLFRRIDPQPVSEHIERLGDPLPTEPGSCVIDGAGAKRSLMCIAGGPVYWRDVLSSTRLSPADVPQPVQVLYDAGRQQ